MVDLQSLQNSSHVSSIYKINTRHLSDVTDANVKNVSKSQKKNHSNIVVKWEYLYFVFGRCRVQIPATTSTMLGCSKFFCLPTKYRRQFAKARIFFSTYFPIHYSSKRRKKQPYIRVLTSYNPRCVRSIQYKTGNVHLNGTLKRVRVTNVTVQQQKVLHILSACLQPQLSKVQNPYTTLYFHLQPVRLYHIFICSLSGSYHIFICSLSGSYHIFICSLSGSTIFSSVPCPALTIFSSVACPALPYFHLYPVRLLPYFHLQPVRLYHIFICSLSGSYHIFPTLSHKRQYFRKQVFGHEMCVLISSTIFA